jgi:hypothetical protein
MPPFIGTPTGFSPATLKLLDAALTNLCADFQGQRAKAPIANAAAAPLATEIDTSQISPPKNLATTVARRHAAKKAAANLRFSKVRGWYLR